MGALLCPLYHFCSTCSLLNLPFILMGASFCPLYAFFSFCLLLNLPIICSFLPTPYMSVDPLVLCRIFLSYAWEFSSAPFMNFVLLALLYEWKLDNYMFLLSILFADFAFPIHASSFLRLIYAFWSPCALLNLPIICMRALFCPVICLLIPSFDIEFAFFMHGSSFLLIICL